MLFGFWRGKPLHIDPRTTDTRHQQIRSLVLIPATGTSLPLAQKLLWEFIRLNPSNRQPKEGERTWNQLY